MAEAAVKKVIKCFCNCSELKEEDIKNILLADGKCVLKNPLGKKLFITFVKIGHTKHVPAVLQYIECYELCDQVIQNPKSLLNEYQMIQEKCPDYELEFELGNLIDIIDHDNPADFKPVKKCLRNIKHACKLEIEKDRKYHQFRIKMKEKLN